MLRVISCIVLSVALFGCVGSYGSFDYYKRTHEDGFLKRASFDMDCPAEELSVVPLGDPKFGGYDTLGVTGCDKKITYVRVNSEWVANVGAGQTGN